MLAKANAILQFQHGHVVMLGLLVVSGMIPHSLNLDLLLLRIGATFIMETGFKFVTLKQLKIILYRPVIISEEYVPRNTNTPQWAAVTTN